jgi:hypothetical protein
MTSRMGLLRRAAAPFAAIVVLVAAGGGLAQSVPKVHTDRDDLVTELLNYQFSKLDRELCARVQQSEADPSLEMNTIVSFYAFDSSSTLISARLDDWVKAAPDSYAAALARAMALTAKARQWRGTGRSQDIPAANLEQIDIALRGARDELKTALAIHPNLALAYALRIRGALLGGTGAEFERARADGLAMAPTSFAVRDAIMFALRPRWGGSREAMQNFALASQDYAAQNPALRYLDGWVDLDAGDDLADAGHWQQAIDSYTRALQKGGEYWVAYRHRANAFYAMQRWNEAFNDATRAEELFPGYSENLKLLAYTTAKLNQPDASILWASEYLRFEMPDPWMMELARLDAVELKGRGKLD